MDEELQAPNPRLLRTSSSQATPGFPHPHGLQQLTGLETWFKLPGANVPTMKPPPRWKMWLVSLMAVYPLVLAFQALVVPRVAGLPLPLQALMFPLVLLTLLTFVVMPAVTRLLRRWLGPRKEAEPPQGQL